MILGRICKQLSKNLAFCFLILTSCIDKAGQESAVSIDITTDMVSPKHYIVAKSNETLVIDGVASESSWSSAPFSDSFIDIEGVKTPRYDTRMKLLWDDHYLYVYAELEEPHIWGDITQRDAVIFHNNDFEVFVAPSATTKNYCEIEINALGTVWDLHLDQPYRDRGKPNNYWNLTDMKTAVRVEGTLNNPTDEDSLWSVEMAIPMKALAEFKASRGPIPLEGEQWKMNFSRVEWDFELVDGQYERKKDDKGKYLSEYNWVWSSQNVINMHEPERWGVIQFTNEISTKDVSFVEDGLSDIRQVAYALLRQTKNGSLRELLTKNTGDQVRVHVTYGTKNSTEAIFNKTFYGFEFEVKVPDSEARLVINETGTLKEFQ